MWPCEICNSCTNNKQNYSYHKEKYGFRLGKFRANRRTEISVTIYILKLIQYEYVIFNLYLHFAAMWASSQRILQHIKLKHY